MYCIDSGTALVIKQGANSAHKLLVLIRLSSYLFAQ